MDRIVVDGVVVIKKGSKNCCPFSFYRYCGYARNASRIPAATALPITPATLGPIACIRR